MYSQFRVQNFRGFKDLELKDLARVNLIAGKNNVGKTSLLETLGILSGKTNIVLARTYSGIANDNQPINTRFNIENLYASKFKPINLFYNFDADTGALIIGNLKEGEEEIYTIRHVDKNPNNQRIAFIAPNGKEDVIRVGDKDILFNTSQRRFPLIIMFSRKKENFQDTVEFFSSLKRQKKDDLLIEALKPIESELKNIDLLSGGLYLNIPRLPELMPLDEMGDGLVRLTNIILAISAVQDGILLIDEIENGLHYSIQTDVWKAIAKAAELFNVQIFATTHSLEMITAAQKAFQDIDEDAFRYYRLDRDEAGDIHAVKYSPKTMSAAIDMNYEVRG